MNELEAIRWHLERYRAVLAQQVDRLYNALEELQRTTLLLLEHSEDNDAAIDKWLQEEKFGLDEHDFFLNLPLLHAFRENRAPSDAISFSWPKKFINNATVRRRLYAHRHIGPHLQHIHKRLNGVGWIYYQDATNTAFIYPYVDPSSAISCDFNWLEYHTFVSACPQNNPKREIKWTPPTIDYAGEGLIISVSIPVWLHDIFVGIWSIDLPLRYLYGDFSSSRLLSGQLDFVIDKTGNLVLHDKIQADIDAERGKIFLHNLKELGGDWAEMDFGQECIGNEGQFHIKDKDGNSYLMCYARVPGIEWILFSGMPESHMEEAARRRLKKAFQQIGEGNFSHRIEKGQSGEFFSTLAEEFNAMTLRLEQAESKRKLAEEQLYQAQRMESVGRLAGGVAHDFNNMLSVILGYTEMILEQLNKSNPIYNELQEIYTAGKRSMEITRQLLAFARCQTVAPKVLDLNRTVEGMLKMLQRLIGENIELVWRPMNNLPAIKIDPSQVDQILANLCVNSRDAINGLGKIIIETDNVFFDQSYCESHRGFNPGDYVVLSVSDNGAGMEENTINKIFEPFFSTKERGAGTGLGLATVYGIVKQNEGFLNVYSEQGTGTVFKIYLPSHAGHQNEIQRESSLQIQEGRGETILLVEDEQAILKLSKTILERLGYTVLGAKTPGEALSMANEYADSINLLITDVIMPEMNGRDLAEQLKERTPDLKVIFMSGYTANVIADCGVLADGVNFIQKPFSIKTLSDKVREVLGKQVN